MNSHRAGLALECCLYVLAALCLWASLHDPNPERVPFQRDLRPQDGLRVMSWNVGTGMDAGAEGLRNQDLEQVAAVVQVLDPDLVFLQELTGSYQLRKLRELLGGSWSFEMRRIGSGRSLGLLAQRGELHELDSSSLERAQALEYITSEGRRVQCVGLHADAFSATERNRCIGRAADLLHRLGQDSHTLLAGDLNLDLDLDKRRDLFTDDQNLDLETYNFLAERMWDAGLGSGATAQPDRRIDYVFVGKSDFVVLQAGPLLGERAPGMDHNPLVVDLGYLD